MKADALVEQLGGGTLQRTKNGRVEMAGGWVAYMWML
jgi:hypothetical protein